jgi:hypothetical protein
MMNSVFFRITTVVWFLSCVSVFGYSQKLIVETSLRTATACPKTSLVIPVSVINMIAVDSFLLTLSYDPASLTYSDIQQVNLQLAGDTLHITDVSGIITISWKGVNPASILDDTLVDLIFQTKSGNCELSWDTSQPDKCFYLSEGAVLPSLFTGSLITLYPLITLTLDEIDPTCKDRCDANYAAYARGGTPPYMYLWNGEVALFDSIQTGLCAENNNIKITDSKGCILDSTYAIEGLPATSVEVKLTPGDTVYMQNPTVTFSFESKSNVTISDWMWKFGDGDSSRLLNPVHTYVGIESFQGHSYPFSLRITNEYGCDTTIAMDLPIQESKIFIPTVFSPNANAERNRTFRIVKKDFHDQDLTSEYISLELQIFNRYGKRVYKNDNYQSDWDGGNLPDGVYYYVLNAHGFFRIDKYKGSVTILGGGR